MPEGPELLRSRDWLRRYEGCELSWFQIGNGRYSDSAPPPGHKDMMLTLVFGPNMVLRSVDVHGKFMWWTTGIGDKVWFLFVHYGMSGQWTPHETKHAAYKVGVRNGPSEMLAFNDPRHFGTLRWTNDRGELKRKLDALGPDMLSSPPDDLGFTRALRQRPEKTLAESLMDQSVVSGVGNYVKAESLFLAGLSPHRTVGSLSDIELGGLRLSITKVMETSYRSGGATISTYREPDGQRGSAQVRFNVYGRTKTPTGEDVVKERTLDGRTTWWCPQLQR